jgi:hypothetical protein
MAKEIITMWAVLLRMADIMARTRTQKHTWTDMKARIDVNASIILLTLVPRLKFVYALAAEKAWISESVALLGVSVRRKYELFVPERVAAQIPQNCLITSKKRPTTMQLKMMRPRLSGVVKTRTWINVMRQAPKVTPNVVALPELLNR